MAGGYLPFWTNEKTGAELSVMAKRIREIVDEFSRASAEYESQYDNAFSDGAGLAQLGLAAELIDRSTYTPPTTP